MRNLPPYPYRFKILDSGSQIESRRLHSRIKTFFAEAGRVCAMVRAALCSLCFPWPCVTCGELQKYPDVLCETCREKLPRIVAPFCRFCGSPFPESWRVDVCPDCRIRRPKLTRIRSAFLYEGTVMRMIREVKFSRRARPLGYFAEELYVRLLSDLPPRIPAIGPVPLHKARQWERTFDQSALLAQYLGELSGVPVKNLLRRVKPTRPQTLLSGQARRKNLDQAFRLRATGTVPRSVILLDDVVTTGATLEACAAVLRKAGVRKVYGLTIARAVLKP